MAGMVVSHALWTRPPCPLALGGVKNVGGALDAMEGFYKERVLREKGESGCPGM